MNKNFFCFLDIGLQSNLNMDFLNVLLKVS